MPTTKLQFIGTGFRFISWQNAHPETMQAGLRRLAVNGIDRRRRAGPDARHGRRP
jgi:oxaloacetate decarboxylase alpha subunit